MANEPEFFETNAFDIRESMIAFYESETGRTLSPAEVEVLLFGAFAYRETVFRADANAAALLNLVQFSRAPILDYLAQNVGIKQRNPATPSETKIKFTLTTGHADVVIQAGTRVSHADGSPVFAVKEDTLVLTAIEEIELDCECTDLGAFSNGYAIGTITELLDSFTGFDSCENTTITAGGSEQETDEQLRERTYLASEIFSTAGSEAAYKFLALSAHPTIIDVKVEFPEVGKAYPPAGTVAIYPLTPTIPTPDVVLLAVELACTGEDKNPGTDTVVVASPTSVNYTIVAVLTLYNGADDEQILSVVNESLTNFTQEKSKKLGLDIVKNQVEKLCLEEGVYDVSLTSIPSTIEIEPNEVANCTGITVTIGGYTNG